MIMIYYLDKKIHVSWCGFMLDLDSVWAPLKILLLDSFQRCTGKTKSFGISLEGLFRTPDRISHRIHIVRTSCSQLPARSGIFCILVEVIYWPCGLKFVYPAINLAFLGMILKLNSVRNFACTILDDFVSK